MYLDVLGQPMIILGSHEVAIDLLEKRSANYSDRAPSPMAELYVPPAIALKVFEGLPYSSLIHSPKISQLGLLLGAPRPGLRSLVETPPARVPPVLQSKCGQDL